MPGSSSRILYDVPCGVCKDNSSGKHYGVFACDGCAGFFKRSVRRERNYICKARVPGSCMIDKIHRNQCRSCRLAKCIEAGMNKDAVQHERGPRNSTIRRQMELFAKDTPTIPTPQRIYPVNTMPEPSIAPPTIPMSLSLFPNPFAPFNALNMFSSPSIFSQPSFLAPILFINHFRHDNDPDKLCESAARLLFLNVKWTKDIQPFESFSLPDRLLLIEESWTELFILGVAQYVFPLDLNTMFRQARVRIDRPCVDVLESVLNEIAGIRVDVEEYGYLRLLALFKTQFSGYDFERRSAMIAQPRRLQDISAVADIQCRVQIALNIHAANVYPREFGRASQLHQILARVKTISAHTIIELFFRNTIGDITVERIITDMYKSGRIPEVPFSF